MKYFLNRISFLLILSSNFLCNTISPKSEIRIVQLCGSGDFLITEKRNIPVGTLIFEQKEKINLFNKSLSDLHNSQKIEDKKNIVTLHEKIDLLHLEIVLLFSEEGDSRFKNKEYIKAIESYLDALYEYSLVLKNDPKIKSEKDKLKKKIKESHELGESSLFLNIKNKLTSIKENKKINNSQMDLIKLEMKNSPFLSPKIIAYFNNEASTYNFKEFNETIKCSNSKSIDMYDTNNIRTGLTGSSIFKNTIGIEFILISAGEFMMGCSEGDEDCSNSEKPTHKISISNSFYMGRYEVTLKEWLNVMKEKPKNYKDCREIINKIFLSEDNCPVTSVSYNETQSFIKKLCEKEKLNECKYRLPSEAEWEYSARAGKTTKYYWGKNMDSEYTSLDIFDKPVSVGQKKPNDFGLYDMSGNAWEWVNDYYDENYYLKSPPVDPKGSLNGEYKVLRGGSINVFGVNNRTSYRYFFSPESSSSNFGFRLIRNID